MRLIDADKLRDKMHKYGFIAPDMTVHEFVEDELPTVDAVKIVRCKDCKHRPEEIYGGRGLFVRAPIIDEDAQEYDMTCPYLCQDPYYNCMPKPESFCDKGERREDATD